MWRKCPTTALQLGWKKVATPSPQRLPLLMGTHWSPPHDLLGGQLDFSAPNEVHRKLHNLPWPMLQVIRRGKAKNASETCIYLAIKVCFPLLLHPWQDFQELTYSNRISEDLVKRETDSRVFNVLSVMYKILDTALIITVVEHFSKTQRTQSRAYVFEIIAFIII